MTFREDCKDGEEFSIKDGRDMRMSYDTHTEDVVLYQSVYEIPR